MEVNSNKTHFILIVFWVAWITCPMFLSPADGERPEAVSDEERPSGVRNCHTVTERRGRCVSSALLSGLKQVKTMNSIHDMVYISGTSSSAWTDFSSEEIYRCLFEVSTSYSSNKNNNRNAFDLELCCFSPWQLMSFTLLYINKNFFMVNNFFPLFPLGYFFRNQL